MNTAHIHLLVNHFPIVGLVIGALTLVVGLLLRRETVKQTALAILVFAALMAIPTLLTGEGAEETIEHLPGVSHDSIEVHEHAGARFFWTFLGVGIFALVNLALSLMRHALASKLYIVTLLGALVAGFLAKEAGTTGGEIRHTEIRGSYTAPQHNGENDDDD